MRMVTFRHSDWYFVFGSNQAGRHGKGAAKDAADHYGAVYGIGEGYSGRSYAIPTKDKAIKSRSLDEIRGSVARFLKQASQREDITFQVTRIGCGLAGFKDADIAEIFEDCSPNVLLPRKWYQLLGKTKGEFRVVIAGNAASDKWGQVQQRLDKLLSEVNVPIRIVSGTSTPIDDFAQRYAQENNYDLARFEPSPAMFGNAASKLLSETLAWYSDAACIFWDETCPATKQILKTAEREELLVREAII